ncbi:uncharacterized protein LOC128256710 [Drosophila gunungcola]|uniref:Prefoldin subunit 3 n=1 Tax=Drosophila gunungcola TaxID=103775 RepID=A0A9P9YF68_9MUSC|nr:uncharacterized protein LOC128256710 [Drosophila gunungcola]KAI8035832.1 hypothetical protein M5D96_011263 [Drosophila gunungcola]
MFAFMDAVEKPPIGNRKSYMSIPEARLIGDVEGYVTQQEEAIKLQRFYYLQYNEIAVRLQTDLTAVLARLEAAKNNLEMVKKFRDNPGEEFQSLMQISAGVFRWVTVMPVEKVTLKVGNALQMVFDLPEAEEFIKKDITRLVKQRLQHEHDIDFLQDQVNTIEMNLAVLFKNGLDKKNTNSNG